MVDVILLAILMVFFSLAVLFVTACERIIGPDIEAVRAETTATGEEPAAA